MGPDDPLPVHPSLPDGDVRRLRRLIDDAVSGRGGLVAARRTARTVGATYLTLSAVGRRRFFELLATDFDEDTDEVDRAMATLAEAPDEERAAARAALRVALHPRRDALLRRFAGLDGGIPFLVSLREDLLGHLGSDESLRPVESDLRSILSGWFDVALLNLEQLTWDSPASLLEKLIEYEAVHAIESWDDLKGRLGPGRRCYAFLHPAMPDDPLIFVEVALTRGIATSLGSVIGAEAERIESDEADTAIFYSISNCHRGLSGVSLGDYLIKSVAERLAVEETEVKTFATLSPLPGFRRWLERAADDGRLDLSAAEVEQLAADDRDDAVARLAALVAGPLPPAGDPFTARAEPVLLRLGAHYLVNERRGAGTATDPVAHFHLSNGARVERLNWWANPSTAGWERGLTMMVNYRYDLRHIERNHDRYAIGGDITMSDAVRRLVGSSEVTRS